MKPHARAAEIAAAVAGRDSVALAAQIGEDVRFRALLPGGLLERSGRDEVVAQFEEWFREFGTIVLDDAAGEEVGDRLVVHYRLVFEPDADRTVLTQTWACKVADDGRLARIDLLCTGYRRY